MAENRTQKATYSMVANGIFYLVNILFGLLNRRCLIRWMGIDYQGINGLFTSVLSVLELAELGVGTAIIYHLYKPLAENNVDQIKSIMAFYRRCYTVIAFTIATVGGLLCINIEYFVGTSNLQVNIRWVFALMLADVIASYTFAYKRSILYADQKNYLVANVNTCFVVFYNSAQLLFLYVTRNYYIYLSVKFILRLAANIAINIVVKKQYPYLSDKNAKPLDREILKDIFRKVKGLMCHKIGTFIVNGTDNIFISKFIDLATVGMYANYNYVITALNSLLNQMIDGATGSVGNLLVSSEQEHRVRIFREMNLLNLYISTMAISVFSVIIDDFISLFFGPQFLLSKFVLIVLIINMLCNNQRRVWGTIKTAAGIQYEDRWVPLYESVINLLMSVLMFRQFGLAGIFIGTLFTHLGVFFYTFPVLVNKGVFGREYREYLQYMFGITVFQGICVFGCYIGINRISAAGLWISMIIKAVIAFGSVTGIFFVVYGRTTEFCTLKSRLEGILHARNKRMH